MCILSEVRCVLIQTRWHLYNEINVLQDKHKQFGVDPTASPVDLLNEYVTFYKNFEQKLVEKTREIDILRGEEKESYVDEHDQRMTKRIKHEWV